CARSPLPAARPRGPGGPGPGRWPGCRQFSLSFSASPSGRTEPPSEEIIFGRKVRGERVPRVVVGCNTTSTILRGGALPAVLHRLVLAPPSESILGVRAFQNATVA